MRHLLFPGARYCDCRFSSVSCTRWQAHIETCAEYTGDPDVEYSVRQDEVIRRREARIEYLKKKKADLEAQVALLKRRERAVSPPPQFRC